MANDFEVIHQEYMQTIGILQSKLAQVQLSLAKKDEANAGLVAQVEELKKKVPAEKTKK